MSELTKAAVAAAREQDAEVCDKHSTDMRRWKRYEQAEQSTLDAKAIRALQSPDGLAALREFGFECFKAGQKASGAVESVGRELVDRVLKGE